jgi:hypothetical protein
MNRLKLVFLSFLTAFALLGCAGLGLAPAQTFDQKLAYAYGTHTAVLQGAEQSLTGRTISSADAGQVLKLADESRTLLDAARAASQAGDPSTANGKMALATQILVQLQAYLRGKQ